MKKQIIELRKKGHTINEIVKELNCAKSTVSYHINKIGLGGFRNKFIFDIDDEFIQKIKTLRLEGKSYKEILLLFDISKDRLKKICNILNLNGSTTHLKEKTLDRKVVTEYYKNVLSLRKTAIHFKLNRSTIRKYVDDDAIVYIREVKYTTSKSVTEYRRRLKIKLVEHLGGSCCICGYNKTIQALQFHHKNPKEKDFNIGGSTYGYDKMKIEAEKCILVCSNCHIEIHEKIREENRKLNLEN